MITRTRMAMAAAIIIIVITLSCVGGGCPAGTSATWFCPESAETCWSVCE